MARAQGAARRRATRRAGQGVRGGAPERAAGRRPRRGGPGLAEVLARPGPASAGGRQPLTFWIPEIVDWAWLSAEFTDDVPVIADWIAVQIAWDTFG